MILRVRNFALITYCSSKQVQNVCSAHSKQIRGYAYITHDKDDGEKHIHLLIRTYDAWTPEQVGKWFGLCQDDKGDYVNTFNEPISDLSAIVTYLTHSDVDSIKAGKARYSEKEIIDFGLLRTVEKKDSHDNTYQIISLMEKRTPLREILRIYGKDFLYHYKAYKEFLDDMHFQERWNDSKPLPTSDKYHWFELADDDELPF